MKLVRVSHSTHFDLEVMNTYHLTPGHVWMKLPYMQFSLQESSRNVQKDAFLDGTKYSLSYRVTDKHHSKQVLFRNPKKPLKSWARPKVPNCLSRPSSVFSSHHLGVLQINPKRSSSISELSPF